VQLLLEKKSADVPKILDVGSGVGKFCLIAALASEARFLGVEQRGRFVELSRSMGSTISSAESVIFPRTKWTTWTGTVSTGSIFSTRSRRNRTPEQKIDPDVKPQPETLHVIRAVRGTQSRGLAQGARVVTYFGFGGRFPASSRG